MFRCSFVVFWIISCSREAQGNSAQFMETSGGQNSPDAMHSDVLAHSGASSLGAMWVQGSPWVSLVGPWGVVLDSLWGTDAPDTTHTDVLALSVFLYVLVFVFSIVSGRLLGRPIGRPRAPYAMHTDVSSVFTGAIRLHAAREPAGLSGTQRHLGSSQSSKLYQGEYKVLDLLYLSIYLSIYLSNHLI